MESCVVRPITDDLARLFLEVIHETGDDGHLTPCDRSRLLVLGLYERRQDPDDGGIWHAELTPLGFEVLECTT